MNTEQAMQAWRDILTRGTDKKPTEAVLDELHDYSGLPIEEIREIATHSPEITAKKWAEADRSTPEGLRQFYLGVTNWVFGTLSYHARQAESTTPSLPVDAAVALADRKPGVHLDFGCGVGTASLLFARMGWKIAISDVSPPLLNFASWRMKKAGIDAEVIDLNTTKLKPGSYDLITAFNTMAHVPNPAEAIRDLHAALRPGGVLLFDIDNRKRGSGNEWHLYEHHYPIIRQMRRIGFGKPRQYGMNYIYERKERSPLEAQLVGFYDTLRYNGASTWVGAKLRGLKRRLSPA